MNKLVVVLMMALLLAMPSFAQDSRNRLDATIVQDVLAQLPASDKEDFDREILDLVKIADRSVAILSGMFKAPGEQINSQLEYAISGMVAYVSDPAHQEYEPALRKGFREALVKTSDKGVKAFLLRQYRLFAAAEDIPVFAEYIDDAFLAADAMSAIISTEGGKDAVLALFHNGHSDRDLLVSAATQMALEEAELYLIKWYQECNGDAKLSAALGRCGTKASLRLLSKGNVQDYLNLLHKLPEQGEAALAVKKAKSLLKSDDPNVRAAALDLLTELLGRAAAPWVYDALKDDNLIVVSSALENAETFSDDKFLAELVKKFNSFPEASRERIVYWVGEFVTTNQVPFLESALKDVEPVQSAAIVALGKTGGQEAASVLLSLLDTPLYAQASDALVYCNGDISKGIETILSEGKGDNAVLAALSIASMRGIKAAADEVFALLDSDNAQIRVAAGSALAGVVSYSDIDRLAALAEKADSQCEGNFESAIVSAFRQCADTDVFESISSKMDASSKPYIYFPSLGMLQTKAASERLYNEYQKGCYADQALAELMKIDDLSVLEYLLKIGLDKSDEKVIGRYVDVLGSSAYSDLSKYTLSDNLLKTRPSSDITNNILKVLAKLSNTESFTLASQYLDDDATSYNAALAVKNIGSKCRNEIDYAQLKPVFDKATVIFSKGIGRDDVYAISEMEKILSEVKPEPQYILTEQEKAQGYEILFDGTNLDKWIGSGTLFKVVNGAITVCANFGERNLYTKEQYRDFILRFEFCFTAPGANNGVGIRTPLGVNAAYHGMCEVQILDHDAPIYADLMEYQVHGSVYGVIPAKRIVHKPLGEWGTQEIEVRGDHIKVTVNGEVIVDGDIRKACQGHHVAPDGTDVNPYTVDKHNHPGMFNEKGHIGFLAHGPGIKIKSVRILNLDK